MRLFIIYRWIMNQNCSWSSVKEPLAVWEGSMESGGSDPDRYLSHSRSGSDSRQLPSGRRRSPEQRRLSLQAARQPPRPRLPETQTERDPSPAPTRTGQRQFWPNLLQLGEPGSVRLVAEAGRLVDRRSFVYPPVQSSQKAEQLLHRL